MTKSDKRKTSARRGGGHVVVVCPQCGKRVKVPAQLGLGQTAYPCPNCRVPITRDLIEAAAGTTTEQPQAEQPQAEQPVVEES
jgi:uncharacterized paraquat-inducible protein A